MRDYLIAHPQVAQAYGALKLRLASNTPDDRRAYARAKSDFIEDVMRLARTGNASFQTGTRSGI